MKFALIDEIRVEAFKGAKGICPVCSSNLIAKCGETKINHWAHKSIRKCDSWWEPETEWHRSWKNNFPDKWQEFVFSDKLTGEKHIADICTSDNLVVEFQHSHIDPLERSSRERFYKNMVWVVDCMRLKRDYPRFLKGRNNFRNTNRQGIFFAEFLFLDECFPSAWLNSPVPVIFDFKCIELSGKLPETTNYLYCLFPLRIGSDAVIAEISRKAFINTISSGEWQLRAANFMDQLKLEEKERKKQFAELERLQASINSAIFMRSLLQKKRHRRF